MIGYVLGFSSCHSGAGSCATGGSGVLPQSLLHPWLCRLMLPRMCPVAVVGGRPGPQHHTALSAGWNCRCVLCLCPPGHAHVSAWKTLDAEVQTVTPNHLLSFGLVPLAFPQALAT